MMERNLVGVLLAIFGLLCWASAAAAAPAGKVVMMSGSCTDNGRALKQGDAVQIGDTVDVAADGHLKLQMSDGSTISVAPGSSMTVASYNIGDVKLSLTHRLLHVASVTRPFAVSTSVGTASVGSDSADWVITVQAGSAQVGVLAGTIDLTSLAGGQSVSIPAHWGTRLEAGRAPVLPRVWTQMEFNAVLRVAE